MKKIVMSLFITISAFAIEPIVTITWLDQNLDNKNLKVIEVSTLEGYKKGHIPNATHTSIENWRSNNGVYLSIKSSQELEKEIQKHGISKTSEVVLYADIETPKDFLKASYIFWALNYAGVKNVALLDGGKQAWIKDIAKLSKKPSQTKPSEFKATINHNLIASKEYVEANLNKIPMIDARPSDKYLGITPTNTVKRDGHISGAMSYSWNYSVDKDYILKDKNKLESLFKNGYNLDKNKEVLVYCTGGLETSYNYFVLSGVLDYKHVRLYDASMKEWGNLDDTPITKYKYEIFENIK